MSLKPTKRDFGAGGIGAILGGLAVWGWGKWKGKKEEKSSGRKAS